MIERIETKATLTVSDAGEIVGIAWPFGSPDRVGDVIEKGAFRASVRLPMLFAHDQGQAIGVWDEVAESDQGLVVKGRLLIDDVSRAREVRALVREGAVTGLSIGFVTKNATTRRGGGRTITALELHEISVVPIPSHPGARVISMKTAGAASTQEGRMADEKTEAAPEYAALETKMGEIAETVKGFGRITERLDRVEAKLNRPGEIKADNDNGGFERKAFFNFMRKGVERMEGDEVKALTVANDSTAGYLAPPEYGSEIIKKLVEFSPIRQYARVVAIGATEIRFPRRTGGVAGYWVAETDDRTGSSPSYEQVPIAPGELATFVDVSNALLEDNAYNLEGELSLEIAEGFGKTEGTALVSGDGVDKPKGLMAASGIAEVKTGATADFPTSDPADVIIGMFHKLPNAHAQNAVWLMNRNTLGAIRKWKDGQGRYLVLDPISEGAPTTLLGRPVVEAVDMADIGANAYPIMFGDLQGYRIVDRVGLSLLRDPYTLATKGQVRFHARRRVGGDVTHPDRFVKLKVAA
ncbi:MAG: phage major capsid protein [Proteobacteria bacterium]|nr:phage major capsid protein [Pseudomonadota bacterium]